MLPGLLRLRFAVNSCLHFAAGCSLTLPSLLIFSVLTLLPPLSSPCWQSASLCGTTRSSPSPLLSSSPPANGAPLWVGGSTGPLPCVDSPASHPTIPFTLASPALVVSLPLWGRPFARLRSPHPHPHPHPPGVLLYRWRARRSPASPFSSWPLHRLEFTTFGPCAPSPGLPPDTIATPDFSGAVSSSLAVYAAVPTTPGLYVAISSAYFELWCETTEFGRGRTTTINRRLLAISLATIAFRPSSSGAYPHSSTFAPADAMMSRCAC